MLLEIRISLEKAWILTQEFVPPEFFPMSFNIFPLILVPSAKE
jgi:hypothetical protein